MAPDAAPTEPVESPGQGTRGALVVPARFCGPPRSANGGYVARRVAAYVGVTEPADTAPRGLEPRAVTTVLRAPVPLDTTLTVTVEHGQVTLLRGDTVYAQASPGTLDLDPPEPVSLTDAVAAGERFVGYARHPMPTCFGCGPDRQAGDGIRLAVGAIGDGRGAGGWQPAASLLPAGADGTEIATEFVWTVLDCASAWAWDFAAEPALLGTMTGIVDEAPYAGDRCVVVAGVVERSGRKVCTASALYDADGRVLGRAQSMWITVDPTRLTP